jgi:predicted secreted protein
VSLKSRILGRVRPRGDARGRKVVAVIECHVNQNARDRGAARHPSVTPDLLDLLRRSNAGLLQIPCPEMHSLGLARQRPTRTSLREAMEAPESRARCRELARDVANRIEDYVHNGVEVVAVLGGDVESPGCAVHEGPSGLASRSGIFMQELSAELGSRDLDVPFRGIRESRPETLAEDLRWIADRIAGRR